MIQLATPAPVVRDELDVNFRYISVFGNYPFKGTVHEYYSYSVRGHDCDNSIIVSRVFFIIVKE